MEDYIIEDIFKNINLSDKEECFINENKKLTISIYLLGFIEFYKNKK